MYGCNLLDFINQCHHEINEYKINKLTNLTKDAQVSARGERARSGAGEPAAGCPGGRPTPFRGPRRAGRPRARGGRGAGPRASAPASPPRRPWSPFRSAVCGRSPGAGAWRVSLFSPAFPQRHVMWRLLGRRSPSLRLRRGGRPGPRRVFESRRVFPYCRAFWITVPYQIYFVNVFSRSIVCLFISSIVTHF